MFEAVTTLEWIIFIGLIAIFIICSSITVFFVMNRMKWPFLYEVWENVNGKYIVTKRGRCRKISFGDGGEEIFFLKNMKKWRVAYGQRVGKNKVAWAVGDDGYWYNVTFGNLNKRLRELGVEPVDRDMRYAYASVRKGIEHRYNDKTFMEKYGTILSMFMVFLCICAMGVTVYITFDKINKGAAVNADVAKTQKEVMQLSKEVLGQTAQIKNNNLPGGLVPA